MYYQRGYFPRSAEVRLSTFFGRRPKGVNEAVPSLTNRKLPVRTSQWSQKVSGFDIEPAFSDSCVWVFFYALTSRLVSSRFKRYVIARAKRSSKFNVYLNVLWVALGSVVFIYRKGQNSRMGKGSGSYLMSRRLVQSGSLLCAASGKSLFIKSRFRNYLSVRYGGGVSVMSGVYGAFSTLTRDGFSHKSGLSLSWFRSFRRRSAIVSVRLRAFFLLKVASNPKDMCWFGAINRSKVAREFFKFSAVSSISRKLLLKNPLRRVFRKLRRRRPAWFKARKRWSKALVVVEGYLAKKV